jgi:hypothetical protein
MPRTSESSMSLSNSPACTHVFPKTSAGVTRNVVSVPATNGTSAPGPAAVNPVTSHAAAATVTVTGVAGTGPFPCVRTSLGMRTVLLNTKVYTCRHPQTCPLSADQVGLESRCHSYERCGAVGGYLRPTPYVFDSQSCRREKSPAAGAAAHLVRSGDSGGESGSHVRYAHVGGVGRPVYVPRARRRLRRHRRPEIGWGQGVSAQD